MTEFKFNCPKCDQRIQTDSGAAGGVVKCPTCGGDVLVPVMEEPKEAPAKAQPKPEAPHSDPPKPDGPRVAVVTSEIKLDMVRAVRRKIADPAGWMPGLHEGANAYAAKEENGKLVPVDVASPEASRFSLMGAFVSELHTRNIPQTANGRRRFLDQEIPDAIRTVLLDQVSEEDRGAAVDPVNGTNVMGVSHAESLAALDVLEERCSQKMEQAQAESARRKLGNVRLSDLITKVEAKEPIGPDQVATALYYEVMDLRRRLDRVDRRLEGRAGTGAPAGKGAA